MEALILAIKRYGNLANLVDVLKDSDEDFETIEELTVYLKEQAAYMGK